MTNPTPQRVAIAGAGMLGMTMAHRMAAHGHDVTIFEASPNLGGLANAWALGDVIWDRHYHVTLLSDMHIRSLLSEIGLEKELQWVETKTGFYTDDKMYSMSNSVEFLKFPPLGLISKFRLASTIMYASKLKSWKKLEKIPVADWLKKLSGRKAFNKIWLPLLRAKLGENYRKTSAAFIWATIARMYAARRTGLKREMFGYVPGGYDRILQRLGTCLMDEGVKIETCQPIQLVRSEPKGKVTVETKEGTQTFDQVVLTTTSPVISRVCPNLSDKEHEQHNGIQYQGIVCASALLKKPLDKYYVTNITDSWVPFTAVIEMSALVDKSEFGGRALVYLPKYVPPDDPMLTLPDDDIQERFLGALEKMYPHFSRSDVESFRISRVKNVVALSTLNYSENLPPMKTSMPGVFAINSAHIVNGTLNVNESVHLANETVKNLLLPELEQRSQVQTTSRTNNAPQTVATP